MHYTVYKTTNKINGKCYIGTHKTKDLNDGYMGSGTLLKRAIAKYGVEQFTKEILFDFDNPAAMKDLESNLNWVQACLESSSIAKVVAVRFRCSLPVWVDRCGFESRC